MSEVTATHPYFDAVINEAVNEYGLTEGVSSWRLDLHAEAGSVQASMQVIYDSLALFPVAAGGTRAGIW